MQIKDMTTEQLQNLIRETVHQSLDDYFDPDEGKELNPEFEQSLLAIRQKRQQGRATVSFEEVCQQFKIES